MTRPQLPKPNIAVLLKARAQIITTYTDIEALPITSEEQAELATDVIKRCRVFEQKVDTERKKDKAPILAQGKAIDESYKALIGPVADARTKLNEKLSEYARERAKAERAEIEQNALAAAEQLEASGEADGALAVLDASDMAPTAIRSDSGASTHMRDDWKYEVITKTEVPEYLKVVDDRLVKQAIKDGKREIPGLRIWNEQKAVVR